MNRIMLFLLIPVSLLLAQYQNPGYIKFESSQDWVIELNDSLKLSSNDTVKLESGIYSLKARPVISYSWPAIFIEDTVEVAPYDTLVYVLKSENSVVTDDTLNAAGIIHKPVVYSENRYIPSYEQNSLLKNTLIITAITSNWLSFYLKRQADDYYDKYRAGSNLKKINNYYDKTQQFDTLSGVMLGVSAAALSTYIYLTLSSN